MLSQTFLPLGISKTVMTAPVSFPSNPRAAARLSAVGREGHGLERAGQVAHA